MNLCQKRTKKHKHEENDLWRPFYLLLAFGNSFRKTLIEYFSNQDQESNCKVP